MALETKIALAVCQDVNTPRSLAMAILLSVALGRPTLAFGLKPTAEEKEKAWVELLSFEFNPYADVTIRPHGLKEDSVARRLTSSGTGPVVEGIIPQLLGYEKNIEKTRRDYQATVFLQKWKGLKLRTVDPVVAAQQSFWKSEKECANTNARFRQIIAQIDGPDGIPVVPSAVEEHLLKCRKIFRELIGPLPRIGELELRFGPGSVYEKNDAYGVTGLTVVDKLDASPHVTPGGLGLFYEIWKETTWFKEWFPRAVALNLPLYTTGRSERFFTVHKKATMARACALGPGGNIALQLAIARPLRQRLQAQGLLLKPRKDFLYQEEDLLAPYGMKSRSGSEAIHHQLAWIGSLDGEMATVDFSRASDTVARLAIKFLASPAWYELLDSARSKTIEIDFDEDGKPIVDETGKPVRRTLFMEKFSSMGCGFTFELETLIFYTLARSVCDDHELVSVYGDDVILPSHRASAFMALAKFFGFTPNSGKTYVSGNFRESCGGDFLHGQNIRPYFQKEEINEARHIISLVNGLHRASDSAASSSYGYLAIPWKRALEALPLEYRDLRGPEVLGDAVIHCVNHERWALSPKGWCPDRKWRHHGRTHVITQRPRAFMPYESSSSHRYYRGIKVTAARRPLDRYDDSVQLLAALYGVPSTGVAPRGALLSTGFSYYEVG